MFEPRSWAFRSTGAAELPSSPAVARPRQTPSLRESAGHSSAGEMSPAAWLQTINKSKKEETKDVKALGCARRCRDMALWVICGCVVSELSITPLWAVTHLRRHMNTLSADQHVSCSGGSPFDTPRRPRAGPKPGVFQLLLPLWSRGGFSGGFPGGAEPVVCPSSAVSGEGPEHPIEIKSARAHPGQPTCTQGVLYLAGQERELLLDESSTALEQPITLPRHFSWLLLPATHGAPLQTISQGTSIHETAREQTRPCHEAWIPGHLAATVPQTQSQMSPNTVMTKCLGRRLSGMHRIAR